MKQTVRLTESEFRAMIQETINEALQDEGLWNKLKTGAKTFVSNTNKGDGITGRFQNAKKNYRLQGEYENMQGLIKQLSQFIDAGEIDPNTTIAQLVGGKYNSNKFGRMTGKMNNRMSQMRRNGLN